MKSRRFQVFYQGIVSIQPTIPWSYTGYNLITTICEAIRRPKTHIEASQASVILPKDHEARHTSLHRITSSRMSPPPTLWKRSYLSTPNYSLMVGRWVDEPQDTSIEHPHTKLLYQGSDAPEHIPRYIRPYRQVRVPGS